MHDAFSPRQNSLLASLPAAEYKRVVAALDLIHMPLGMVLYGDRKASKHAYFPLDCIVSLLHIMRNGDSAEIAMIGREGIVGVSVFMGGATTPSRAVVQSAGHAYRIPAETIREEFRLGGPLQYLLLRSTQALLTQMAQTAACNRHHSIDQQLCRWLLLSIDRLPSNELYMTQELIAGMLGVRREGVTEAAGKLQAAGAIQYRRGRIAVLDRSRLERSVCECYGVVKNETDRLLDGSYTD
jgi:CRP-like cAMP-binding protein